MLLRKVAAAAQSMGPPDISLETFLDLVSVIYYLGEQYFTVTDVCAIETGRSDRHLKRIR